LGQKLSNAFSFLTTAAPERDIATKRSGLSVQRNVINKKHLVQKRLEVQSLKNGIRILNRAIEEKIGDAHLGDNQIAKCLD